MAAINPISGGIGHIPRPTADVPKSGPGEGGRFSKTLLDVVNGVEDKQQASHAAIQDLLTGKTQDVLPVVMAVAKADMSFKLLIGVRNKVIEAYKQTMNMQV